MRLNKNQKEKAKMRSRAYREKKKQEFEKLKSTSKKLEEKNKKLKFIEEIHKEFRDKVDAFLNIFLHSVPELLLPCVEDARQTSSSGVDPAVLDFGPRLFKKAETLSLDKVDTNPAASSVP